MSQQRSHTFLFGGDMSWTPLDWKASDDRVRGGKSISHLTCLPFQTTAEFHGHLDITTLGGAGFASQRTTGRDRRWDLSRYEGIELDVEKADGKKYTLILKDELLPKREDGREQSTVSWEFDFATEEIGKGKGKVFARWDEFKATYRGKEKEDAKPLDLKNVERISLMMRSFFGAQEGDFSLKLISISAADAPSRTFSERYRDDPNGSFIPRSMTDEKQNERDPDPAMQQGIWSWFLGLCTGSAGTSKT